MAKYLLGIDCGTSVVKCMIMDLEGTELVTASRIIPALAPEPGYQEVDMYDFWKGVTEIVPEAIAKLGIDGKEIVGVGVTGQGEGNWMIDKDGEPVGNAILWSDGRAGNIVADWMDRGVVEQTFEITGVGPFAGSSCAILRWTMENNPDKLKKAVVNLWPKDWIEYCLTGVANSDYSDTAQFGIDIKNLCWSDEVLKLYGVDEFKHLLPELKPSTEIMGYVTKKAADITGLAEGTPVVKGMVDMVASAAGVGCVRPGDACTVMGTTLSNEVVTGEPCFEPKQVGFGPAYAIPGEWLRIMSLNYGMPNQDWFLKTFCRPYYEEAEKRGVSVFNVLSEVLERTPVGAHGVMYHPYLCAGGERAPFVKPTARAQFFGLVESTTLDDCMRAVIDGMALAMIDCYSRIPVELNFIALCGGGARNPALCQILADAAGAKMNVPQGTEFGAKAVAMWAGVAAGIWSTHDEAVKACVHADREYFPNMDNNAKYMEMYKVYDQLKNDVFNTWDMMADLRAKL